MMLGDVIFNKVLSMIYGKDVWLKKQVAELTWLFINLNVQTHVVLRLLVIFKSFPNDPFARGNGGFVLFPLFWGGDGNSRGA